MSDEQDPIERDAIRAQDGARDESERPRIGARLFAILLLIVVTPFLLLAGYCGLVASATLIGPIFLVVFGTGAFIAYKGVQALWMAHDPQAGMGWVVAFVIFAVATVFLYLWLNQPLGWHN